MIYVEVEKKVINLAISKTGIDLFVDNLIMFSLLFPILNSSKHIFMLKAVMMYRKKAIEIKINNTIYNK